MTKRKAGPKPVAPQAEPRDMFAARAASQAWERISLPDAPDNYVWAWFKPAKVPQGLILKVPDEMYRDQPQLAAQWTMRRLLQAAAIEPTWVSAWVLAGVSYPLLNGASPFLDAPLPGPVGGTSPEVVVYVAALAAAGTGPFKGAQVASIMPGIVPGGVMPGGVLPPGVGPLPGYPPGIAPGIPLPHAAAPAGLPLALNGAPVFNGFPGYNGAAPIAAGYAAAPMGIAAPGLPPNSALKPANLDAATADIYERIEADWNSSNEIEKDLSRLRKQLVDVLGRVKNLNRDLTGPERVHSNNQDKKDWQDARRCLRDASNKVWRYIKAHDIGDTSNAGKRVWFDEIYRKYIAPRQSFDGLMAAARAFESHRKTITTLHGDMSNAFSFASLEGERKAQQVLNRIQTKVREASNKKNFLGVMLDS